MIWAFRHMRLILACGALAGAFYGGYALALHREGVKDLRATVAAQDAALRAAEKTAKALVKFHQDQNAVNTALDDTARAMAEWKGRDAPLSDFMRAAAGRLYP